MPIFEYRCDSCGDRVAVLIRSSRATPTCPDCDSPLTDKLFSVPNLLLGRGQPPKEHACCGRHEQCDKSACACGGECQHH